MFAANHVIAAFLFLTVTLCAQAFPADIILPNGIRLFELPASGSSLEILAGYRSGGRSDAAAEIKARLSSSAPARALALAVYGAGGHVEFFNEIDRTGFHVTFPAWAQPLVVEHVAAWFRELPVAGSAADRPNDFRGKVEQEIRGALLGPTVIADVSELFQQAYGTDRAFAGMSGAMLESAREDLAAVPARISKRGNNSPVSMLTAQRNFRFVSDLPTGAVIFAVPVSGVYYDAWYSMLVLDRLLRRVVPGNPKTSLLLTVDPYYYRLEIPVPAGQFPEPIEEMLLQEIERLRLSRAANEDMDAARREARDFLESPAAVRWFASQGIPERREEGLRSIETFSVDDIRAAVRDLLIPNRVVASWAPSVKQLTVNIEPLTSLPPASPSAAAAPSVSAGVEQIAVLPRPFPPHSHTPIPAGLAERLSSGVSIISSSSHGIFVAGGALTKLEREPDAQAMAGFQNYRSDRILVLVPEASMDRARQLWSAFKGNAADTQALAPRGSVILDDLPALVLLKIMLDRKLIESGLWNDVKLQISAGVGASMEVNHPLVREWITRIAADGPSEADMAWSREAAVHHFDDILPDLQAIIWERVPQWILQDVETVSENQIQAVARKYF